MWSLLALLTAMSGSIPPFQLLAMTFIIATLIGLIKWIFYPPNFQQLKLKPIIWLTGIGGLFGYHFFYYTALQNAPVANASLIAYLWPLLIVLFSSMLPGEKLRWYHGLGACLGFLGAVILIWNNADGLTMPGNYLGYGAAFLCAFIWSGYSVTARAFKKVPSDVVVIYCLGTALLAILAHLILEQTSLPQTMLQWVSILALGLFPVGLAFYVWDFAMKHGPIQLLGSAAYFAPILSTIILVVAGLAPISWQLVIATILVTMGAIIAAGGISITSGK